MFSKTFTSDLTFLPNNFSKKFKNISALYSNDLNFIDSYLYGLKRQHNYLSSKALLNNSQTYLNPSSVEKLINFNYNYNYNPSSNSSLFFFSKFSNNSISTGSFLNNDKLSFLNTAANSSSKSFLLFENFVNTINDNSDKKTLTNPIYKILNLKHLKLNLHNKTDGLKLISNLDYLVPLNFNENKNYFLNTNLSFKNRSSFSPNQSVMLTNKNLRSFTNISPFTNHQNYNLNYNPVNSTLILLNKTLIPTTSSLSNLSNAD